MLLLRLLLHEGHFPSRWWWKYFPHHLPSRAQLDYKKRSEKITMSMQVHWELFNLTMDDTPTSNHPQWDGVEQLSSRKATSLLDRQNDRRGVWEEAGALSEWMSWGGSKAVAITGLKCLSTDEPGIWFIGLPLPQALALFRPLWLLLLVVLVVVSLSIAQKGFSVKYLVKMLAKY